MAFSIVVNMVMRIPSTGTQAIDNGFLSLKLNHISSTDAKVLITSDDTDGSPDRGGNCTQRRRRRHACLDEITYFNRGVFPIRLHVP